MKILHVTNAVEWSGGMEQISLLVTELEKNGHENLLACPPGSKLLEKLPHLKEKFHLIPMRQDYDVIAARKLRRLWQKTSTEIVHAHHSTAHAVALLSVLFSKIPPLIITRRVSFPPRKNPFSRWKYLSRRIHAYSVVSQSIKDTLVSAGVDSDKIRVIYSAANPEKFSPREPDKHLRKELGIPEDFAVVGKLANYSPWKGQHVFLQAAKKILEKNKKVFFLLVGKNTESLEPLAKELGIFPSVRICGFRKDIPEILSLMDVSVNSAVAGEGLSGAMRESLLMTVPVIATDVAGNREIVQNGKTGFLVPPDKPGALADWILFMLKDPPQAKKMAEVGRTWVKENASPEKMIENTTSLYQSLLHLNREN